jgi:acyl dehydratase
MKFRMRRPVYPGEKLVFSGTVRSTEVDEKGVGWVDIDIELTVGDEVATEASARLAIPRDENDNPWRRSGDDWRP